MSARVREQVQAGIDARVDEPVIEAAAALSLGYATMLGLDGTSVEDAADLAWTPTGPSKEVLLARIAWRRGHKAASAAEVAEHAASLVPALERAA